MRRSGFYLALAALFLGLGASPVMAQTVREFISSADRIPRNATALLHPATRRLMGELRTAFTAVRSEQEARVSRGQPRTICMPERVSMDAQKIETRFLSIPEARRNITVTQAVREWMAEEYPC